MKRALAFLFGLLVPVAAGAVQYVTCPYNAACRISFSLYDYTDPTQHETTTTVAIADGDIHYLCDDGTPAEDTTSLVAADITETGTYGFTVALAAGDTQCEMIKIDIIDATATEVWFPHTIVVDTFGNASAKIDGIPTAAPGANGGVATSDGTNLVQTVDTLGTGSITAAAIATDAIGAAELAADAIGAAEIAADAITSAEIATGAIGTTEFAAETDIVSAGAITTSGGAVSNVTTVATTTTNTDMRGTDSALLAASAPTNFGDLAITATTGQVTVGTNNDKTGYSISGTKTTLDALNDVAATDIVSAGAITTSGGAVSNVTTVATTTTNTDMRGTDSALLAASAPANFGDLAITLTTGQVTVGTNNDKAGYSISGTKTTLDALNDVAATDIVSAGAITTSGGAVSNVTLTATTTDVTNQFGGRTDTGTFQTAAHSSTSMVLASGEVTQDNQYKHWSVIVTSGDCIELSGRITDSVATNDTITVSGFDDGATACTPDTDLDGATYVLQAPTGIADDLAQVSDTTSAIQVDASGYVKVSDGTGTGQIDTDAGTVLLRSATETQIDNIDTGTPNVAPDAAGGLVISDAGGLDIDGMNTNVSAIVTDVQLAAEIRDTAMRCTVDNTNFAPTTTVIQCDLADFDATAITPSVANKYTGMPICNKTATDDVFRDCRYIIATAQGDTDTNEWKFTVDRAWTAAPDNASVFFISR